MVPATLPDPVISAEVKHTHVPSIPAMTFEPCVSPGTMEAPAPQRPVRARSQRVSPEAHFADTPGFRWITDPSADPSCGMEAWSMHAEELSVCRCDVCACTQVAPSIEQKRMQNAAALSLTSIATIWGL